MKNILIVLLLFLMSGCSDLITEYPKLEQKYSNNNPRLETINLPETGADNKSYAGIVVDYSNVDQGYIMLISTDTEHKKYKVGINKDGEQLYYDINLDNEYISYPLLNGSGEYEIKLMENIENDTYAIFGSLVVYAEIENEYQPFLYPNVISHYNADSECVKAAFELTAESENDLERVYQIYKWVIKNVDYDYDKLEEARKSFLIPDVDLTYTSKKGICFDYSALMCAMLRPLNIPVKLVTGYVDLGYHAWVEIYIEDIGWIDPEIYFDSDNWSRIDPTFESMGSNYNGEYEEVKNY